MSESTITRILEIDAGHRLLRHESKCRNAHGHRYKFEIKMAGALDDVGRIIDFGVVKSIVGGWLDENWDHGFIVQNGDPLADALIADGSKVFVTTVPPTAENLAAMLADIVAPMLAEKHIRLVNVRCWETPNCFADSGGGGRQ